MSDAPVAPDSTRDMLRRVPLFEGLADDDLIDLSESSKRYTAPPGLLFIEEGADGNALFVILSGEVEVTKRDGDRQIVLARRGAGDVLGEMSLLEQVPRTASVRTTAESELLEIDAGMFQDLLNKRPAIATSLLRTVAARLRSSESLLVQGDKLAALGTLAAGLAHELNNPAAAIQRSASLLDEAFSNWRARTRDLDALSLDAGERAARDALEAEAAIAPRVGANPAEETRLIDWLEALGVPEPWDIAPAFVEFGWTVEKLAEVATGLSDHAAPIIRWLGTALAARQLLAEIELSSKAISAIVRAVKSYAYLDQAAVQNVDLRMSLEDTLMILNHKLKHGVEVVRDYDPDLPRIEAYAGELNQVWTNLIDNAVQAMDGKGRLEVTARRLGDEVEVVIADNGPGIPAETQPRIFDPFFTTKPQGQGTGLGLHIARNIVVDRHHGRIDVESAPGRTEFHIVLPAKLSDGATPGPSTQPH
ncbi:MAG: ATP-binding protein [Devosia sp.]